MGTIEATVSMLETMPEEARLLVFNYTQELFSAQRPANPFTPISTDKLLSDLRGRSTLRRTLARRTDGV